MLQSNECVFFFLWDALPVMLKILSLLVYEWRTLVVEEHAFCPIDLDGCVSNVWKGMVWCKIQCRKGVPLICPIHGQAPAPDDRQVAIRFCQEQLRQRQYRRMSILQSSFFACINSWSKSHFVSPIEWPSFMFFSMPDNRSQSQMYFL